MHFAQKLSRKIIKHSFNLAVKTIESFHDMKPSREKVKTLRALESGTLGREIADCLDAHNLSLIPGFESHDLKHVLLDFRMTPEGEIRMQAFMIGNGNLSVPSFAIMAFGGVLLPDCWRTFYSDFLEGQRTPPISHWKIADFAHQNLNELRAGIKPESVTSNPLFSTRQVTTFGAYASIVAGILGMSFCLPFLFSSNLADLVGAGFPFIGGAILAVGGLLALSNLARFSSEKQLTYVNPG